ncbi:hypothetical protein C8R47DRAFT_1071673 [Mycena vitilis]|nr:hypothetical protein C8R47DRAFT_1071673 [Mycena vitilis]
MWGRWDDAMVGIRGFYQLDEPIRQGMVEDAVEYVEAYVEALTYVDVPYRTDGEVPETWAEASPIAGSTRQMGAGGRRDFLHDLEDRPLTKVQLEFLAWRAAGKGCLLRTSHMILCYGFGSPSLRSVKPRTGYSAVSPVEKGVRSGSRRISMDLKALQFLFSQAQSSGQRPIQNVQAKMDKKLSVIS